MTGIQADAWDARLESCPLGPEAGRQHCRVHVARWQVSCAHPLGPCSSEYQLVLSDAIPGNLLSYHPHEPCSSKHQLVLADATPGTLLMHQLDQVEEPFKEVKGCQLLRQGT